MSRGNNFEGVVLKKTHLLDASFYVSFFTKSHGKMSMIAKGAKKLTSKKVSHLQTGNFLRWYATPYGTMNHHGGETVWYIGATTLLTGLSSIKEDKFKVPHLYNALHLIDLLLPDGMVESAVYSKFMKYIVELSKESRISDTLSLNFAIFVIQQLGYGKADIVSFADLERVVNDIIGWNAFQSVDVGQ
jgi:DNA repair protein RecO